MPATRETAAEYMARCTPETRAAILKAQMGMTIEQLLGAHDDEPSDNGAARMRAANRED